MYFGSVLCFMPSAIDLAKRALVSLLRTLAAAYGVALTLTRDAPDKDVSGAYRKVSLKTHPDRGGKAEDQTALNNAHDAWEAAKKARKPRGGKRDRKQQDESGEAPVLPVRPEENAQGGQKGFRFQSQGVLLTYQKFPDSSCWKRFVTFVKSALASWKVRFWCATLETNHDGGHHLHLMLQFFRAQDRNASTFAFEGVRPNGEPNDLLGQGWGGRRIQKSLDRGFFYVWAAKEGTVRLGDGELCVAGNYEPAWTKTKLTYTVKAKWLDDLLGAHKLSMDTYEEYLFLCQDTGTVGRKRNLDALRARREKAELQKEVEERVKRLRGNKDLFQEFKEVPEAQAWLRLFEQERMRYPMLIVMAPSHTGKTEFAKSLFKKPFKIEVGVLAHFPEKMRQFSRKVYDGLVVDDVRDLAFLSGHQEKLQANYETVAEFGSTAGGTCAFEQDLWRVPVVVTINKSTRNLDFLATHDYLSKKENVHFLAFSGRPGDSPLQTRWPLQES